MLTATAPTSGTRDRAAAPENASTVPPRLYANIMGEPNKNPDATTFTKATDMPARASSESNATTTATLESPSFTPGSATGSGIMVSI